MCIASLFLVTFSLPISPFSLIIEDCMALLSLSQDAFEQYLLWKTLQK